MKFDEECYPGKGLHDRTGGEEYALGGMSMIKKKKTRKKVEFSKIIFMGVSMVTIAVTVFSCVMIYRTGDLSPLAYLIPSVFTELATATGFYYRKAQKENEIKLPHYLAGQNMGLDGTEETLENPEQTAAPLQDENFQ